MEYDFRLTARALSSLSTPKQTSGNIAIGTVDHEQASRNAAAVGGSDNYLSSTSVRSIRIVPSRSGDVRPTSTTPFCSPSALIC